MKDLGRGIAAGAAFLAAAAAFIWGPPEQNSLVCLGFFLAGLAALFRDE